MDKKNIVFYTVFFLVIIIIIFTIINQLNLSNYRIKIKYTPKFIDLINTKLNDNSSKLIFISHLELGDSITLNGAVRYFCSKYNTVIMPCKKLFYKQVQFMYSDLSNLILYKVPDKNIYQKMNLYIPYDENSIELYNKYNINIIAMGCFISQYNSNNNINNEYPFPLWSYKNLNLNINLMYNNFKINRNYERENELYTQLINIIGDKYVVIIDDEKRNFTINSKYLMHIKYPIFKMSNNSSNIIPELNTVRDPIVFNNIKILENAQEIISIDSSIPWIIDILNINVKTTIHTYMRDGNIAFRNKNITIISGSLIERLPAFFNISTYNSKFCNLFN